MRTIEEMGMLAKEASYKTSEMTTGEKNAVLLNAAQALLDNMESVLAANKADVDAAIAKGITGALIDRLTLNESRIEGMADGLRQVANLKDPVGEFDSMTTLENGLTMCGVVYYILPAVKGAVLCLALIAAYAGVKDN